MADEPSASELSASEPSASEPSASEPSTSETDVGSVAHNFKTHHEEIKRRSSQVESDDLNKDVFDQANTTTRFPVRLEGQEYVLFTVSHVEMSPVAEKASEPAIRFYGLFASVEDAVAHAKLVQESDKSCNLQVSRVATWNTACRSPARIADDAACRKHVESVLEYYKADSDKRKKEFTENVEKKRGGETDTEKETARSARLAKEAQEMADSLACKETVLQKSLPLRKGLEAREQTYVVVSFLPDRIQTIPEFVWKVYAAFNTVEECDIYVRNTLGHVVKDVDIDVCTLGEFLFPQNVARDKLSSEVWRSEELSKIMSEHKAQPQKVAAYKEWMENTDK